MVVRKYRILMLLFIIIFASACGKSKKEEISAEVRPTDIKIITLEKRDTKDKYTLPGVLEAWEVVSVPTETSGPIRWIGPAEGDRIKQGDPIMRINTEDLAATLNSMKVQYESKQKDFTRTSNLFAQQSVSQKAFDDAKDALALAEVSYKLALDEYNKGTVKSPVTGIIDDIPPKIGEYVSPGTKAATVVQMDKLKLYIEVPEKDIAYLKIGQSVDVYPADASEASKKIQGVVNYISVSSNPQTLTYKTRVDVEGSDVIRAGRIVRADVIRHDLKDVYLIDMYSVMDNEGQKYVFLEKDGKSVATNVTLGTMLGTYVVVDSGLKEGDRLVVSGQQFLHDGGPVRIAE